MEHVGCHLLVFERCFTIDSMFCFVFPRVSACEIFDLMSDVSSSKTRWDFTAFYVKIFPALAIHIRHNLKRRASGKRSLDTGYACIFIARPRIRKLASPGSLVTMVLTWCRQIWINSWKYEEMCLSSLSFLRCSNLCITWMSILKSPEFAGIFYCNWIEIRYLYMNLVASIYLALSWQYRRRYFA